MKKEVLLSLLMTTPVAFPALACDLGFLTSPGDNGVNWTPESNGFVDGYKAEGNGMVCPVGIKNISRVLSLPQGEYKIDLTGDVNCKLSIEANSNVEVKTSARIVTGFVVKSGKDCKVTVKIEPKNVKDASGKEQGFSFTGLKLDLICNWAKKVGAIKTAFDNAKLTNLASVKESATYQGRTLANTSDKVVELKNEKKTLDSEISTLESEINPEESLDNYKKYELYNDENVLIKKINNLKAKVDPYKKAVADENTRFDNFAKNTIDKTIRLEKQVEYVQKIQDINDEIAKIVKAGNSDSRYASIKDGGYEKRGKDLAALLAPYKASVEETYADSKIESKVDASALDTAWKKIENEYEIIYERVNGASDDKKAWNEFKDGDGTGTLSGNAQFIALRTSYQKLVNSLAEDKNVDDKGKPLGYPANAFAEKVTELNKKFEPLYRTAAEYVSIEKNADGTEYAVLKNIGGAAGTNGTAAKAIKAIEDAQEAVNTVNGEWNSFVDTQKAAMKTAYAKVKELNKKATDKAASISVPSQLQEEVNTAKQAVLDAVTKMKNVIDAAYGKNLEESTYSSYYAKDGAVDKAQKALDDLAVKAEQITKQHSRLDKIKADIKKADPNDTFLNKLYAGDLKTIEDAFAALTKINDNKTTEAVKDGGNIDKLLTNLEKASEGLPEAYAKANVKALEYKNLTDYVNSGKKILAGAEGIRSEFSNRPSFKALTADVNAVDEALNKAVANHKDGNIMQTYNAIVLVGKQVDEKKIAENIVTERAWFTENATVKNKSVVQSKLTNLSNELTAAKASMQEKPAKVAEAEGEIAKLQTALNGIKPAELSKEKDFNDVDKKLQSYVDGKDSKVTPNLPAIEKLVANTLANYRSYVRLENKCKELATQLGLVAELNETMSKDPAKTHFDDLLGTQENNKGYWKTANSYHNAIDAAFKATKLENNAAALEKKNYITTIANTIKEVQKVADNIRVNESEHQKQLDAADRVNKLVQEVQTKLAGKPNTNWTPAKIEAELKAISEEMLKINREVVEYYGNGDSESLTRSAISKYDTQEKKAQALVNSFNATYSEAVAEENEKRLADKKYADGTSSWNQISAALTSTFDNSIDAYIKHAYKVTNAGYKAYIEENGGLPSVEALYDYQPEIAKKKAAVEDPTKGIIAKKNAEGKLVTDKDLEDAVAEAKQLIADMKQVGDQVNEKADNLANGYWLTIGRKLQVNKDNINALKYAGIEDKFIDIEVNGKPDKKAVVTVYSEEMAAENAVVLAAKKLIYKTDSKGNLPQNESAYVIVAHPGQVMDDVANYLDQVIPLSSERGEEIARKMWSKSYDATTAELSKRINAVNGFSAVPEADRKAATEQMNEAMEEISKINEAVGKRNTLFSSYLKNTIGKNTDMAPADKTLAGYWKSAEVAYDVVKDMQDNNTKTNALYTEFTNSLDAAVKDYEALRSFGGSIAGSNAPLKTIKATIETLRTEIGNKGYVTKGDTDIDERLAALKNTTIPNGYKEVVEKQYTAVHDQVNTTLERVWAEAAKTQHNVDAKFLSDKRTQIDNLKKEIAGKLFSQKIDEVADEYETTAEKTAAYKAIGNELLDYEKKLSAIEIALKSAWTDSPVDTIKAELTEKYNETLAKINSLSDYDESVQAEFASKFEGFRADLDKVADAWTAAGDNIVMQKVNFVDGIEAVDKKVVDELAKVKVKDLKVKTHKAAYKKLSDQYSAEVENLAAIKDLIEINDIFFYEIQRVDENNNPVFDKDNNPVMYKPQKENYLAQVATLEARLANTKKNLEEQNAAGNMDPNSALAGFTWDTLEQYDEEENKPNETVRIPDAVKNLNDQVVYTAAGDDTYSNARSVMSTQLETIYDAILKANILPDVRADILVDYDALAEKAKDALVKENVVYEGNWNEYVTKKLAQALKNLEAARGIIEEAQALQTLGEENTFKRGDINLDGAADVADLQMIITLVGERTTYDEFIAANGEKGRVKAAAADMNDDQRFTSADINAEIAAVQNDGVPAAARIAMARGAVEGANIISTQLVSEEAGVRRYAVNIDNTVAFATGQIDLALADGTTLVDVVAADRAAGHEVALFHHGASSKRVVLYNMDNATIEGQNGTVIYVDVIGDGTVSIEEAIFADRNSIDYRLRKPEGTSGIEDTVIDNNGSLKQRIYNAAGQALRGLQRGVNIIRNADGSVSKEYHK